MTARVNPTILGAMLRIARPADGRSAAMKGSSGTTVGAGPGMITEHCGTHFKEVYYGSQLDGL